ncbi:MAG TPA: VanZ family protein [Thermoanaerobaculia bacterium]|nr:VanZ family protein [Thermoanaerobaculia bacterium]
MPPPPVTTITLHRGVTVVLLMLMTILIVMMTLWISGKSYSKIDPVPFEEIRHLAQRLEHRQIPTQILALIIVPIVANILMFVPWGFLLFIALHTKERPTVQIYVLTVLLGLTFTLAIEAYQYFLPSRVADINDVIYNTMGTTFGAMLGHLRERVRFEFE